MGQGKSGGFRIGFERSPPGDRGDRPARGLHDRVADHRDLGGERADLRLLRHLAVGDQHWDHHRDVLDGVPDQQTQNKDTKAIELKLNELVAAIEGASNRLIDVEDLSEHDLDVLHGYYGELVALAKQDSTLTQSHSLEEARRRHADTPPDG